MALPMKYTPGVMGTGGRWAFCEPELLEKEERNCMSAPSQQEGEEGPMMPKEKTTKSQPCSSQVKTGVILISTLLCTERVLSREEQASVLLARPRGPAAENACVPSPHSRLSPFTFLSWFICYSVGCLAISSTSD